MSRIGTAANGVNENEGVLDRIVSQVVRNLLEWASDGSKDMVSRAEAYRRLGVVLGITRPHNVGKSNTEENTVADQPDQTSDAATTGNSVTFGATWNAQIDALEKRWEELKGRLYEAALDAATLRRKAPGDAYVQGRKDQAQIATAWMAELEEKYRT